MLFWQRRSWHTSADPAPPSTFCVPVTRLVSKDAVNFCILPVLAQTAAHLASALDPEVVSGFILTGMSLLTGIFLLYVR